MWVLTLLGGSDNDTEVLEGRNEDVTAISASSSTGVGLASEGLVTDGDALSEDGIQEPTVSPSSSREGTSGYLAGSGSSTTSIHSAGGADESADRIRSQESVQPARQTWVPGKRHPEEVSVCLFANGCRAIVSGRRLHEIQFEF